ncbi:MAG: SPFH domain-containing protein [Eubacteriales bacterium]|nr:SPFH domain-containing protein [Eubacteriales bacterium]
MGLIKAAFGAAGGTLADQWKEFFYCDSLSEDVLAAKGEKRVSGRSSNTKGESNIITDGSHIAVSEGQCMIIVEEGRVLEVCAEPGGYTYDTGTNASVFGGSLMEGLEGLAKEMWSRFQFGGDTGKDQRIYYFNTKEILGNKYGTPNPVPFRVVDQNIGLDVDISIRCNGEYSYRIVNPMLFYTNVCGNIQSVYTRDRIDSMLKTELLTALQPAFAKISAMGIRYSALPGHTTELADALNEALSKKWTELRGIQVYSFGINSVTASKEDEEMIKELQKIAVMRNPNMAAANLTSAQADAMRSAAKNANGAMAGFMGMGLAQQAGGANVQNLFAMGQQQAVQPQNPGQPQPISSEWRCECGTANSGKFCTECGKPRPKAEWVCACGTVNKGNFCTECGSRRP